MIVGAGLALISAASLAQTAEPAAKPDAKAPPPKSVDELVVTGQSQQQDRVEIDRRSYSLSKSLQAQTGTVADLLRTIPSVGVDLQGNVTLRGDPTVTIMVDGKPSGVFSGAARSTAVQSLPADAYERVEVVTNPSAADGAEGGGGIINLITKQTHKVGYSGSAKVGLGERGQAIAGINGGYNSAALSLSGDLNVRGRDPGRGKTAEDITVPLTTGGSLTGREVDDYNATLNSAVGRLAADYDVDARTRIGARLQGVAVQLRQIGDVLATTGGEAPGVFRQQYDNPIRVEARLAGATLRRKFDDDQELTADVRANRTIIRARVLYHDMPVQPVAPDAFDLSANAQTTDATEVRVDHKAPSFAAGELKLGYDLRITRADLTSLFGEGPTAAAITEDPARSGAFDYRETLNAAYVTLQRKLGGLTVLAGLRLEDSQTTTSVAGGARHEADLLRPFPSLHLAYPLGDDRTVSASYSRRIDRPTPTQLNPLVRFGDRQDLFSGNPALRPQETDAVEVAYDAHKGASSLAVTAYYRALHNAFAPVVRDRGAGVVLFTQDNLGDARRAGLSLAGTRSLGAAVSLNLSGDAYWTQVPVSALGLGAARSGTVLSGRGAISWTPTANDLFQLNGRLTGRTITPQGSVGSIGLFDLGYRHKLTSSLFAVVTVQNLLDSNRQTTTFSLPTLTGRRTVDGVGRTALVTLTYNFGAGAPKPRAPAIDYSAAPAVPR